MESGSIMQDSGSGPVGGWTGKATVRWDAGSVLSVCEEALDHGTPDQVLLALLKARNLILYLT